MRAVTVTVQKVFGRWAVRRSFERKGRVVPSLEYAVRLAAHYAVEQKRLGDCVQLQVIGAYGARVMAEG